METQKDSPESMRLTSSERSLLAVLLHEGACSRSELTHRTHLSQQSVHRILDDLHGRGFVDFAKPSANKRGKPSPTVKLAAGRHASVGISVTTEDVNLALLDLAGNVLEQGGTGLPPSDPQNVLEGVSRALASWRHDHLKHRSLIGVGVAMQGYRTGDPEQFHPPPQLREWQSIPIRKMLARRFSKPVFLENNATASVIAEHYAGAVRDHDCIVYLSFNHGFGGGTFLKGNALIGERGNAGELTQMFPDELVSNRPALGELLKRLNARGVEIGSVDELVARFDPDWPGVDAWIEEVRPQLGWTLRALKAILDPGVIVFGGEAPGPLRRQLIEATKAEFRQSDPTPNPPLVESAIEGDAAHLGAAFLPLQNLVF
ncbi:MAG: ROK family transcriptional regulator [Pseudomonadota bacterium]